MCDEGIEQELFYDIQDIRTEDNPTCTIIVACRYWEKCPLDDWSINEREASWETAYWDLPGKALRPGMRFSLEPVTFSPGAAAAHKQTKK